MQLRKLKNFDVSPLGFGCMRFPTTENKIDEKLTEKMLNYAVENGVNYFDTAYPYHEGMSEKLLGKLFNDEIKKKIIITTKLPCWEIEKYEDFDRILDEQLERLKLNSIDIYLIHALYSARWEKMQKLKIIKFIESAKQDGRIKNTGFSFHDNFSIFKNIIDSYDKWDLCQIQLNYMNEDVQAGIKGLKYAYKNKLPVIIMEPLLGGLLANPPKVLKKIWENADLKPVETALRWLWNQKEVTTVLSGMSNFEQVKENIEYAKKSGINTLSEKEKNTINEIKRLYRKLNPISCTKCRYCMPCPHGVDIPRNIEIYNEGIIYNEKENEKDVNLSKAMYNWHMRESEQAGKCTACKLCEKKCPQNIKISDWMKKIDAVLKFKENVSA